MRKRIYFNFLCLILLCAILLAASVSTVIYTAIKNTEMAGVRDRAVLTADLLNQGLGTSDRSYADYANYNADTARITIISPDGTVLLDNKTTVSTMDNHSDREEFIEALQTGEGEITRYSETLKADTYFYAIRLDDGNVLRVSMTMSNITQVFSNVVNIIALTTVFVLLIAMLIAHRLTTNIVAPLEKIDFSGENIVTYDELIPYMRKIDRQKREINEQVTALQNRANTIEDITSHMREGLILLDHDGTVLAANKSVSELFGETIGSPILSVCRDIEFQKGVKLCLSGEIIEILFERDDKIYSVHFSPAHNDIGGAVILFFDVTARHESEKQRREFSANVSHELKTPLTSISAYAELIETGMVKDGDIQGFASKILTQAKRLICIIDDIIRLSEFDEANVRDEYTEFDLFELALYVVEVLREKAESRHISVDVTGARFYIKANRQMIDELLYNLIDNGIKYSKDGGLVTVALSCEKELCKIEVTDDGVGIPNEHHNRVFERFYRVDKSRDKKTGGTGLGLSIVKHIAEHHSGSVELISEEGKGTTVVCWLGI